MAQPAPPPESPPLSKRAARRLIQRAFVLAGRHRNLRGHIRETRLATLWVLEDWNFAWSVMLERGKLTFDRRPAKRPDATLTWQSASGFFAQIEQGHLQDEGLGYEGPEVLKRIVEPLLGVFAKELSAVLRNPVDENGDPLL